MRSGIDHLLAEGVISEVIARLKSGKEADVYVVRYGGRVVAAKVYKDRAQRSFKNNAEYKEGRQVRNSRSQRAIERGSKFGQASAEDAWKSAEVDALYKLHAAEVRVPTPVMYLEGVLLMELVLDADGDAAPRIIDTDLTVDEANACYRDMLTQLVRILSCDLIHGDLSPYNVLWAAQGPTIIDFPQAISAAHNSRSEFFFLRDANNILGHFASIDRSLSSRSSDAAEIWRAYMRRELTVDFVPTGRMRPPPRPHAAPRAPQQRPQVQHQAPQQQHQQHQAPQRPQREPQHQQRPQHAPQQHAPQPQHQAPQRPQREPQHQSQQRPQREPQHQQRPQHAPQQHAPQPQHQAPQHQAPRPHAQRSAPRRPVHTPEVFVRRSPQAAPVAAEPARSASAEGERERSEAPAHRRRRRPR